MTTPSSKSNGWVARTVRFPTEKDADSKGYVLVHFATGLQDTRDHSCVAQYQNITHWQPLPPPPESPEQRQARLDNEAYDKWLIPSQGPISLRDAWLAGAAHARRKEDGK